MENEVEIKGLGRVISVVAPFDKALAQLSKKRANLISLRDFAYARIQEGIDASVSRYGSYVKEGAIYVPGQKIILTRDSPIVADAERATSSHRNGERFYVDAKQYLAQVEEDKNNAPEERRAIIFSSAKIFSIPANRFADEEITRWAFGDQAKQYGEFLRDSRCKIEEMTLWLEPSDTKKPFATQMSLLGFDFGATSSPSSLLGIGSLNDDYKVFGLLA